MLVLNYNIDKFVKNPPKEINFFLIHGNDIGYIAKTKELLSKTLLSIDDQNYEIKNIDAKEDEFDLNIFNQVISQGSLFGSGKIIIINNFQDALNMTNNLIDNSSKNQVQNNYVIATANRYFSKNANVIKKISTNSKSASISCFSDQQESLTKLIKDKLSKNNIHITNEALVYLNELNHQDRLQNLAEIEKIILYAKPNQLIEVQDLQKITDSITEVNLDSLFDALLNSNLEKVNLELDNIINQDLSLTFIIRTISYNILRLIEFKYLIKTTNSRDKAMESLRPAVFFLKRSQFIHNESKYSLKTLQNAFDRLIQAEIDIKTSKLDKKLQISKMIADLLIEFDNNLQN